MFEEGKKIEIFAAEKNVMLFEKRLKILVQEFREENANDAFACSNELTLLTLLPSPMHTDHVIADTVLSKHSCN